jgi:hypothetical protein
MEIKDIGQNLMTVCTVKMGKVFKIGVDIWGTDKEAKRYYGFGKDVVLINLSSEEYNKIDIAYSKKKGIWIGRQR